MSYIDQILLWDTNYQGIVDLSKSKAALHKKIIANHLLGGHIVVRPAELFEGNDYYFNSAINQDGILFQLLKHGMASLAIDSDVTLEDRAKWRFEKEVVFDRGAVVKSENEISRVKRRTFERAEKLEKAGWINAPIQTEITESNRIKNLNQRFRASVWAIARLYFTEEQIVSSPIGSFLQSNINVVSRSDLYPKIDSEWGCYVDPKNKKAFVSQLKEALTLATNLTTSESFGGKVSDIRNETLLPFMLSNSNDYQSLEIEAINLFAEAMKKELKESELQKSPFIFAVRNLESEIFVEKSNELISAKDRELLTKLLYGTSKFLNGNSFVVFLASETGNIQKKDKIRKMRGRIQELEGDENRSANVVSIIRSAIMAVGAEAALIMFGVGVPFIATGGVVAAELGLHFTLPKDPVFAGFRKSISS